MQLIQAGMAQQITGEIATLTELGVLEHLSIKAQADSPSLKPFQHRVQDPPEAQESETTSATASTNSAHKITQIMVKSVPPAPSHNRVDQQH